MEWIQNYLNCCIWLNRDKLGFMRRIKLFLGQCTLNKILYCNLFKPSWIFRDMYILYTVQKEIDFPRNNMKCSRENVILCIIFHAVSCFSFPQHFMLYRGNLDCFSNSVCWEPKICSVKHLSRIFRNRIDSGGRKSRDAVSFKYS